MKKLLFLAIICSAIFYQSCRKDESFITERSANIDLSLDTITFDTVFTTIGSVTKNFRVYNPHKESIKISSIRLNGGDNSEFRINVDGVPGPYHTNKEIAPKDSLFIFVEVTVDPDNKQSPFVITDEIEFITNGNSSKLELVAWGQNAHYYTPTSFNRNIPDFCCLDANGDRGPCSDNIPPVNVTWPNDLPYVIYGFVAIDSMDVLNIDPGVQLHFHNNSGMWVYRGGTLNVNGTKDNPVVFQGDRLEPGFEDRPGQWDRIWINDGSQNKIEYAEIKNGYIGIQAETLPFENPPIPLTGSLILKNTRIDNCSGFGLLTSLYNIQAENLVITDCGEYNVAIQSAGNYNFKHCSFANYESSFNRETPLFFVQNSVVNAIGTQVIGEPNVTADNSIIYGRNTSEFNTEIINGGALNLDFSNCIIKTDQSLTDTSSFKDIIRNPADIIFNDVVDNDYSLSENSIAKDTANINISNTVPIDILGNSRLGDGKPDLGAFEFIP